MSSITVINSTDLITDSRAVINTNFSNLNSDKIESSYLDTDTTLAANSDTKIATQKAVKAYVDTGGNVNASETTKGIVEEATDAEVTAGTATGATGAKLFITPAKIGNVLKFGGTGADGALSITSGATSIDLGNAAVVTKNYTSISITGTGSLTFTNPNTNGTVIILKSQGNVTLTSSAAPMIDCRLMGSAQGQNGKASYFVTGYGGTGVEISGTTVGGSAMTATYSQISSTYFPYFKSPICVGGGSGNGEATGGGVAGTGVRGSGSLIIECGGAWNFTTTAGISVAGSNGGDASGSGIGTAGGGGGGGAGCCLVFYKTLTANSGTIISSGGTGGASYTNSSTITADGGGGGGSATSGGGATVGTNASGRSGYNGGDGFSCVIQNVEFT